MTIEVTRQEHSHRTWSIVRLFYRALLLYRAEYANYEKKVLVHARKQEMDRKDLRLNALELAELLDFKNLEALRNGFIHQLKDLCHLAFRGEDQTDLLDRYVSDIFHEISILKEEHYTLKVYGPMWERESAKVELDYIVDEAHQMFPTKLTHIDYLFGKALKRMQVLLPSFRSMPIVIRSLYLNRDRPFIREAYPDGLLDFYRFMYTLGPFEGFYQVGLSFEQSGFRGQALEAFERAEAAFPAAVKEYEQRTGEDAVQLADAPEGARGPLRDPALTLRSLRAKVQRLNEGSPSGGPAREASSCPAPDDEGAAGPSQPASTGHSTGGA